MNGNFHTYYRQTTLSLFNSWMETAQVGSVSNLHDLRVQMKRMRAIFAFLQSIYGKGSLGKLPKLTRELFQQAGEWREMQLINQWLQKINVELDATIGCTEADILLQANQTQAYLQKHFNAFTKQMKKAEGLANKTHSILGEQYFMQLSASLKKGIKKAKQKDWHELRKLCKKWIYATNWLEKDRLPNQKKIHAITKLEKYIGDWHECCTIINRLEEAEHMDKAPLATRQALAIALASIQKKEKSAVKKTQQQLATVAEQF